MEKYLIALDMDGTLLNKNHVIDEETKQYLKKLNNEGHIIVIASGRPIRGIKQVYDELELTTPAICYNGAYIFKGQEDNFPEYCFAFPQEIIKQIITDIGYEYLDNVILETNEDIYFLHNDDTLDTFFSKNGMCVHLGDIRKTLNEDPMTMLLKVKEEKYNPHIEEVISKYENIKLRFWSGRWIEISEIYFDDINKGKALRKIAEYYNISPSNIIAFGDATNDIEMIEFAQYGVAMTNAEEEVKNVAKIISENDNHNQGVIKELAKIIK